jgi:hypothetical protein
LKTVEWPLRIGSWYLRWDKREIFRATECDEKTRKSIQTYDGDFCEIDEATWDGLSVGLADPPEIGRGRSIPWLWSVFGTAQNDPVSDDTSAWSILAD